jgi:hypothetical protein
MPSRKRTPISYDLQYAEGIFRPKDVVEEEQQHLNEPVEADTSQDGTQAGTYVPTPLRRAKTRYPFDIYQDQLDTLRRLATEDKAAGGAGSMSAMVREAIDAHLMTLKNNKKRRGAT